jgi:hypothetical protein
MKVRPSIILVALTVLLGIGAAKLFDARSHRLRFDGIYCAKDQRDVGGDLYLRFYPDGTVLSHIRGYGALEPEAMEMYRGGRWVEQGRYSLDGGTVGASIEGYALILVPLSDDASTAEPVGASPPPKETHYYSGEVHSDRIDVTSSYGRGEYKFISVPLPKEN